MSKTALIAAVAAAAHQEPDGFSVTAAHVQTHLPEIAATLKKDGADAERARILGIEAVSMKGHEDIVAKAKADPAMTAADVSHAIVLADKATLAAQANGLQKDERKVAGISAGTASGSDVPERVDSMALSRKADAYIAEQASKGIKVSASEAVLHVSKP
jgi:hypothetical protein